MKCVGFVVRAILVEGGRGTVMVYPTLTPFNMMPKSLECLPTTTMITENMYKSKGMDRYLFSKTPTQGPSPLNTREAAVSSRLYPHLEKSNRWKIMP